MKKIIRNFLQRFGYDIIKTGVPFIPQTKKDVEVKVGNYSIVMPGYNVQAVNYRLYPDLNAQFGRLAKTVHSFYPDMTLIDVGANVGDTIAVVKTQVDIPVIGVEGDEVTYSYLKRNSKLFSDIELVNTFLGEKTEEMKVSFEKSGWNATIIPGEKGEQQISFKTLDAVIADGNFNNRNLKLLKVDVEGFDTIVLRGAWDIIHKHKPVVFLEYNRQNMISIREEGLSTLMAFKDAGYNRIVFFDHKGTLILATSLKNSAEVKYLHEYASSPKNLIGYYDICLFHEQDDSLAEKYLEWERTFL